MKDYININTAWWDSRVDSHYKSKFYDVPAFLEHKNSLNDIELRLLGDVKGKKILHLQCHFGMDSISLAHLGAEVTAVDFSSKAIEKAQFLAHKMDIDVCFIQSDIYNLPAILEEQFDIVFTSYGTIIWLPELHKWAKIIDHYLAPKGKLVFADFHPLVWMYNDEMTAITYPYANSEAIVLDQENSYAQQEEEFASKHVTWNHGLAEVFQALKKHHLLVTDFQEYFYSPYSFLDNCIENGTNTYQIKGLEGKIPLIYSLVAEYVK